MNNEIYNRQLGAIVFIVALCFKIGVLPGLLANQVANPLPLIFCACLLEFLMYALVIRFGGNGGMDMLEKKSNVFYKIVMSVLVVYFLAKGTVLTGSLILMIEELLFDNISVYLVITILLITVTYIAVKGIKGIARMSEMLGPLIALSILVNLVFLKSRMNFANNLPVITDNFSQYIKAWGSYGAWFFDSMPFLFVTLKKRGKRPYVIISYLAAFSVIMVYYVLGNALFGNYLFGIDNFFIKLSSFNFLSDELGRLEWTGIISWVVICIINISVLLWAAIEAGGRLIKKRNAAAVSVIIAAAAAVTVMNPFDYRKFADLSWFGYTLAVLGFAVPLILCVFSEITKRRGGGAEQSDNKPNEAAENNEVRNENEDEDGFSVRKPSLAGTPDTERAAYGFPSEKMSVADTATKKDGNGSQTRKRPPADAPTDKKDSRNSADVKGKSSVKNPLFEDSEDGKDGFALEKPSPADAAKIKSGSVVKKPSPENSAGIKSGSAIKRPPATNSGKGKGGSVVKKPSLTDSAGEESYAPAKVEKYAKRGRPKPEQNG